MLVKLKQTIAAIGSIATLSASLTTPAAADTPMIGGVAFELPAPPGYCPLDQTKAVDAELFKIVTGVVASAGNRLIALNARCDELNELRAGKRPGGLNHYTQYQSRRDLESVNIPDAATAVKEICAVSRQQGEEFIKSMQGDIGKTIEKALPASKVHGTKFIGVLAEDSKACYGALVQKMTTQSGVDKTTLVILATTVSRGKVVYFMRYAPYEPAAIEPLLAAHKQSVEAFLAANEK